MLIARHFQKNLQGVAGKLLATAGWQPALPGMNAGE
jgi:hypothetical protein